MVDNPVDTIRRLGQSRNPIQVYTGELHASTCTVGLAGQEHPHPWPFNAACSLRNENKPENNAHYQLTQKEENDHITIEIQINEKRIHPPCSNASTLACGEH